MLKNLNSDNYTMKIHPSVLYGILMLGFLSSAVVCSLETMIKPGYPHALVGKQFFDISGYMWTFGEESSPSLNYSLMFRSIGHQEHFFAEYYFDPAVDNKQLIFECKKYEVTESSRINIWAFRKLFKQYNYSMPTLCDVCNGIFRYKTRLTDIESDLPASNVSVPDLSDPKMPPLSSCDVTSRGSFIFTEHILVTTVFTVICTCSYLCSFL